MFNREKISEKIKKHNGLSWFSDQYKLIYLAIPKTASTSIRAYLNNLKNAMDLNNITSNKDGYVTFTIIREPVERFVSGVMESFKRIETPEKLKNLSKVKNTTDMLEQYLNILEVDGFIETHITPQLFYMSNSDGELFHIDEILLFENLSHDFKIMAEKYNLPPTLPHKWKNNDNRRSEMLSIVRNNENIKNRVLKLYEDDFNLYNKIKESKNG